MKNDDKNIGSKIDRALMAASPYACMLLGLFLMTPPKGEPTKEDYLILGAGAFLCLASAAVVAAVTIEKKKRNNRNDNQKQR